MKKKRKAKPAKEIEPAEKLIDGVTIRHILVDLGMTQGEISKEMGIAAATMSRIVRGQCVMSRPYYNLFRYTVQDIATKRKIEVRTVF